MAYRDIGPAPPAEMPPPAHFYSEAAIPQAQTRVWRFAVRNRHATIPLSVPLGMLTAAQILHANHLGFEVTVIGIAASVVTWATADRKWSSEPRGSGKHPWATEVTYARATVAGGSLWLAVTAYGGVNGPLEMVLGLGCAVWGGLFWWHKRPRDRKARKAHERYVRRWDEFWQSHANAWGIGGSYVVDVEEHGALESLLIQLRRGRQTFADIKSIVPKLESALGGYVDHGMTRVEVNKANPSQVWVHLKTDDPLREEIEFDEAGLTDDIRDPAVLGTRENGQPLKACLLAGFFILGRSRSGKSNERSVMLAKATRCRNARVFQIDMKGGRAARPWGPALDWIAVTVEEARLMTALLAAEIEARGTYAYNGDEQLTPTEDVPALILDIDETYKVTSEMAGDRQCRTTVADIASTGQGLAVYPWIATQYGALYESVGTEQTRSNLNRRMCFQTEDAEHGTFALGEDARGRVDTTKLAVKGAFYYRSDSKTREEQVRAPHLPHSLAAEIAARNAQRTQLHERPLRLYCGNQPSIIEGMTWQQVYDTRWERLPQAFRSHAPQAQGVTPVPSPTQGNKITNMVPQEILDQVARINAEADEIPITDADIARAAELRAARGAPPIDLRSEMDQRKARFAAILQHAPAGGVSPRQLKAGAGLSESWVHLYLGKLADWGAVRKVSRGMYAAAERADIAGALEDIRRETEGLAAEARELVSQ